MCAWTMFPLAFLLLPLLLSPHLASCELQGLTVLVLLDGFRHDYLADPEFAPEALNDLAKGGAALAEVAPVFPSSRLPNLASLATGAYAETHGVLDDTEVLRNASSGEVWTSSQREFWEGLRKLGTIWVGATYAVL